MYHIYNTKKTINLDKFGEITICGYSRSNYKTGYLILPFNFYLDCGVESPIPANLICISHGHLDHISALYSLLINSNKCTVLLDNSIKQNVTNMLNIMSSLNNGKNMVYHNWIPETNKIIRYILNKNQIFNIYTYDLVHSISCRAYGIKMIRTKIKDEYKNMSGIELKELKKILSITYEVEYPLVLFISDTMNQGLVNLPFSEYNLVIMECTFFDTEHYGEANARCHLHWDDVKIIVKKYPNIYFILGHFSMRYTIDYMNNMNIKIQEEYKNVMLFI